MGTSQLTAAIAALSTLLVAAAVVGWGTSRARRPDATLLWARTHGLALTPGNQALVRWYVLLSGTLRMVGAVSGAVIGSLADRAFGVDTSAGTGFWMWVVAGWMSGGWWAWRQVVDGLPQGSAARLVPRRLADYAPAAARWGPVAGGLVLTATAMGTAAIEGTTPWTVLAVVAAVATPMLAHRAERSVVDRRQPAAPDELVAADDAIRSATIHLVGAGSCAALLLASVALWQQAIGPDRPLPYGLRGWVPLLLVVTAYLASSYLANRPWRVRRDEPVGQVGQIA
jgi:hypothetical protein